MVALLILFFPLLSALLSLLGPRRGATGFATLFALIQTGITGYAYYLFRIGDTELLDLSVRWVEYPIVDFHLTMDGVGLLMLLLTNVSIPFILLSSNNRTLYRPRSFYFLILFMQFALNGVFLANDGLLYYVFWELTLIPAYFILLYWGGSKRRKVTLKFFLFTLSGSLCMMLAFIYLYLKTTGASTALSMQTLYNLELSFTEQSWLFWAFFVAFAIKIPIIPFHTWQADTYHEAPAQGTMILSGLMAKMGLFSLVRWFLPSFPEALAVYGPYIIAVCVAGIIYGSVIAIFQRDMKRLFAYASLSHMGLMAAGLFSLSSDGMEGALVQSFSHGINTIGLFICADIIFSRMKTNDFRMLGGIRKSAPVFSTCFFIIVIATVALPFTNSFVGELVTLFGIYQYHVALGVLASLSLVFGVVYMLRMYRLSMLGEQKTPFRDLSGSEKWVLFPLVFMIILFGLWYKPFFELTGPTIDIVLQNALIP